MAPADAGSSTSLAVNGYEMLARLPHLSESQFPKLENTHLKGCCEGEVKRDGKMPGSASAARLCNLGNLKKSCCRILKHFWHFWKLEDELQNLWLLSEWAGNVDRSSFLLLKCHSEVCLPSGRSFPAPGEAVVD